MNSTQQNDKYFLQFSKIKLWDEMATDIAYFLLSQGYETIMDKIDLTCGAIPQGEYEQVIDQGAPQQFLTFYTHIAEFRFAVAVTEALKMNKDYWGAIKKYCYDKGKVFRPEKFANIQAAYDLLDCCILDGTGDEDTKKITVAEQDKIVWEKLIDTHENYWQKAGSPVDIYYDLQSCFILGILNESNIKFANEENKIFTLSCEN